MKNFNLIIACLCGSFLTSQAIAQTYDNTFSGATNANWNTTTNWSTGTLPSETDSVYINFNTTKVTLSNDIKVGDLTFNHAATSWGNSGFAGNYEISAKSFSIIGGNGVVKIAGSLNIDGAISSGAIINAARIKGSSLTFNGTTNVGLEFSATGTSAKPNLDISGVVTMNATNTNLILTGSTGDYYSNIGGITGTKGCLSVKDNSNAANGYLTLNVAAGKSYTFGGEVSYQHNYWGGGNVTNKRILITKTGAGAQYFTNTTRTEVSTVTVSEGILGMTGTIVEKATVSGGLFGATGGKVTTASLEWLSGGFVFDSAAIKNAYTVNVTGSFDKSAEGKILIDFGGLDALESNLIGSTKDLIVAAAIDTDFNADANKDFQSANIKNAIVNFAWSGKTLQATFAAVPEPAAVAAVLGLVALVIATYRRRR